MPVAPPPPDFELCCGNGCSPCIFDLHDLAMDAYRQSLCAWRARHPDAQWSFGVTGGSVPQPSIEQRLDVVAPLPRRL